MTLNQQIAIIEEFAENHLMINNVVFGAEPEADLDDLSGFLLWFYLNGSSISETRKSRVFDVRIMCVGLSDMTNENELISDCHKLSQDLLAWLDTKQYENDYQLARSADLTNFVYMSGSGYIGQQFFVEMLSGNEYDVCEVPSYVHLADEFGNFVVNENRERIQVE